MQAERNGPNGHAVVGHGQPYNAASSISSSLQSVYNTIISLAISQIDSNNHSHDRLLISFLQQILAYQ